jgi:hypothetical protein
MEKEIIKKKYLDEIEESIWRKEIENAFSQTLIPKIAEQRELAVHMGEEFENQLDVFDPKDHTRETREKKKALEHQIEIQKRVVKIADGEIENLKSSNLHVGKEIKVLKEKAEFVKKYGNGSDKN